MEKRISKTVICTATVLVIGFAGGLIGSTFVAANAYTDRTTKTSRSGQTLNVTGSARHRVRSDLAVWRVDVRSRGKDLREAYAALDRSVERVRTFLAAMAFQPNEIELGAIDTRSIYALDEQGNDTNTIESYRLSREFCITTGRVKDVNEASSSVTELIQEGHEIVSSAPRYVCTNIDTLKVDVIGSAAENAKARAEQIAEKAGCRIAEVRGARMGVLQITRPNSTEVSASGINDTSSIEKDMRAVVGLTIVLE